MFKLELGQSVCIKASGEKGIIEGRAEYQEDSNSYFIHYCAADGRATSSWFNESQLLSADQVPANCFAHAEYTEHCITTAADTALQPINISIFTR